MARPRLTEEAHRLFEECLRESDEQGMDTNAPIGQLHARRLMAAELTEELADYGLWVTVVSRPRLDPPTS